MICIIAQKLRNVDVSLTAMILPILVFDVAPIIVFDVLECCKWLKCRGFAGGYTQP